METHVIGIDGGGTATRAAVLDLSGRLCGVGRSGSSNYNDVGERAAQASVAEAVAAARAVAGLEGAPFAAAFLGLAGVVSEEDRAAVQRIAQRLRLAAPERLGADHDARVALAGGLCGRPGIVLIAGTGSACYGRTAEGTSGKAGGWGALLADEGGGYWLGVEAMKAAVRAADGRGPATSMEKRIKERLDLDGMDGITHRLYVQGLSRAEIAALARLVFDAARTGDAAAQALLQRGAEELAETVRAVAEQLGMAGGAFELVCTGGMWKAGAVYREPFAAALRERLPACRMVPAELPPTLGAGLLALQQAGCDVGKATREALRRAARAWPEASAGGAAPSEKETAEQPA